MKRIPLKKKVDYFVLVFWIVIFLAIGVQLVPQLESVTEALSFAFLSVVTMYFPATYLSRVLLPKALKTKKITTFIIQYIITSIITGWIDVGYLYLFAFLEQKGVFSSTHFFEISEVPPYVIWIYGMASAGFLMNFAMCGLSFLLEYVKSQKTLVGYQLQTLQHQVTPHFMFNVLNHIHVLMQTNVELASDLLIKYSEILRYQLYNGEKKDVSIEQEIQFLKDFIAVEELRWGDKLTVACEWDIEDKQKEIPSLLFITFVENAFKHVAKSTFERGMIVMNFHQRKNNLKFEIKNSKSVIPSNKKEDKGLRLGLKNIKERLDILYPRKHDLKIEETNTIFHILLTIQI